MHTMRRYPLKFYRKPGKTAQIPATMRNRAIATVPVCQDPGKNPAIALRLTKGEHGAGTVQEKV